MREPVFMSNICALQDHLNLLLNPHKMSLPTSQHIRLSFRNTRHLINALTSHYHCAFCKTSNTFVLLLQQTSELSTSPENTFTHPINRKEGSSVTLLSMKGTTNNNSLDEPNEYPSKSSVKPVDNVIASMKYNNADAAVTAVTESCYCGSERIYDLRLSNKLNGPATVYDSNGGSNSVCDSIEHSVPLSDKCNGKSAIKNCYRDVHRTAGNYLIAVHRKMSRQDTYFLSYHKSRPSLFGVPLLIPCYEGGTNKDLYCTIWMQVARLLSPLPPTPPDQSNHATDW